MRRAVLIRVTGILVTLAALGYFVFHARNALSGVDLRAFVRSDMLAALAALTVLYSLCVIPNSFGWQRLLNAMGERLAYSRCLIILAYTQIGKYLPGNIGHHLGRVALARAAGVSITPNLYALGYETVLAALVSVHVGTIVLLWKPPGILAEHPVFTHKLPLIILFSLGAVFTIALAPLAMRLLTKMRGSADAAPVAVGLHWWPAFVAYLSFGSGLVLVGAGLWLTSFVLIGGQSPGVIFFIGAFAASWIIGFLAPGAPAGLGVREALLSAWFGTVMPPAQAVLLVIALRIATTLGDLFNFMVGAAVMAVHRRRSDLPEIHP